MRDATEGFQGVSCEGSRAVRAKIVLLPVDVALVLGLSVLITVFSYRMPRLFPSAPWLVAGLLPMIAYLVIETVGFVLVSQMWARRDRVKKELGPLSYQRMFPVGLAGVIWVLSLGIDLYVPFFMNLSIWGDSPLGVLILPLGSHLTAAIWLIKSLKVVISFLLLLLGASMSIRAVTTFGFDYMTVVYLYFPEESQVQKNDIYSALRHPMYGGMLTIGLGGAILTCSPYSLASFVLFLLGFHLHINLVEERELVLRFGESYEGYRTSLPAFLPRWNKIGVLLAFILGRT